MNLNYFTNIQSGTYKKIKGKSTDNSTCHYKLSDIVLVQNILSAQAARKTEYYLRLLDKITVLVIAQMVSQINYISSAKVIYQHDKYINNINI